MSATPVDTAAAVEGWSHCYSGKVRDLYLPKSGRLDLVLVVASDRISAYDHVLESVIPDKGEILTRLSDWWFDQLADLVTDHRVSTSDPDAVVPRSVQGRAMVCTRLEMFPVECVVRGYLTGSGLADYRSTGQVCGVELPDGLLDGSRLPEPIFTPAQKAAVGDHDENIDFVTMGQNIGKNEAAALRESSLAVYERAERIARERGIILADTKFEFGVVPGSLSRSHGESPAIVLGDEVLTPDSSRFWDAEFWRPGKAQPSFDKQLVRDWLVSNEAGWDRLGRQVPPVLPESVVAATRSRYVEAYERLTGMEF